MWRRRWAFIWHPNTFISFICIALISPAIIIPFRFYIFSFTSDFSAGSKASPVLRRGHLLTSHMSLGYTWNEASHNPYSSHRKSSLMKSELGTSSRSERHSKSFLVSKLLRIWRICFNSQIEHSTIWCRYRTFLSDTCSTFHFTLSNVPFGLPPSRQLRLSGGWKTQLYQKDNRIKAFSELLSWRFQWKRFAVDGSHSVQRQTLQFPAEPKTHFRSLSASAQICGFDRAELAHRCVQTRKQLQCFGRLSTEAIAPHGLSSTILCPRNRRRTLAKAPALCYGTEFIWKFGPPRSFMTTARRALTRQLFVG